MQRQGPRAARGAVALAAAVAATVWVLAPGAADAARLERPSDAPWVPDQIVVALRPAGDDALPRPGEPGADSVAAERIAALRARPGVKGLRRVFRRLEAPDGSLARRARDVVRARMLRRGLAPGPALEAAAARVPALENVFVVDVDPELGVPGAVAAFLAEPDVIWAEPNRIYAVDAEPLPAVPWIPDDRYVTGDGVTWSEGAWGQDFPDLHGLRTTRSIEAWNALDADDSGSFDPGEARPGEGIVVAVIDSGVDPGHPDLAGNLWTNPGEVPDNGIDDDGNGMVDDVSGWDFWDDDARPGDPYGHGTHVAGTIAALADNAGRGIAGVAPHALILPVRALGPGGIGSAVDLAAAVEYAVAMGADITSNSWGSSGESQLLTDAFAVSHAAGVLNVASAGNADRDVASQSPANLDTVMAVAAVDPFDERASFSNTGSLVEIAAPGVDVLSLSAERSLNVIARALPDLVVDDDYLRLSGTSMACPHVSGAAAFLMSARPQETAQEIRGRLMAGAHPIDARNPDAAGRLGSGRLDLLGALDAPPAPLLRLIETNARNLRAGEEAEITVRVRNFWTAAADVTARLSSDHPDVRIDHDSVSLGAVAGGAFADNEAEPFRVALGPDLPFGELPFELSLEADDGTSARFPLTLTVSFLSDVTAEAGVPRAALLPRFNLFQDATGDGLPDILMADLFEDTYFFENGGDGTFSLANRRYGIPRSFSSWASFVVDLDDDGDRDILLGGRVKDGSRLLRNDGPGRYVDVSVASGLASRGLNWAAALDYDGDGLVDVLGGDGSVEEATADRGPLQLLRNRGDLTFEDRRAESGLPAAPFPSGIGQVATLDHDDDGDPDVVFAAWGEGLSLWENEGDGRFVERTAAVFPGFAPTSVAGVAVGDCDDDGDIDLFVTGPPSGLHPPSRILLNRRGVFRDAGEAAGDVVAINLTGVFWGTAFLDIDNDGDLDLYVSKDVSYGGSPLPGLERNPLFLNDGTCGFTLASDLAFPRDVGPFGAVAAMADFDGDGDLDVYSPGSNAIGGRGALLRNEVGDDRHWLSLDLEGTSSARDAYGARVVLETRDRRQTREIHTSPVDPSRVHFGLGDAERAEHLEVRWPSGIVQEFFDVGADRVFRIVEVDCGNGADPDGDGTCDPGAIGVDIAPHDPFGRVLVGSPRALPVALLGSDLFDVLETDLATLAFGPAGAPPLARSCPPAETPPHAPPRNDGCGDPIHFVGDVDRDGSPDLIVFFRPVESGIVPGDVRACVAGRTRAGQPLRGCDTIRTSPACGLGFELVLVLPPLAALRRRRRRRGPAGSSAGRELR